MGNEELEEMQEQVGHPPNLVAMRNDEYLEGKLGTATWSSIVCQ